MSRRHRASALITVVFLIAIMAILTASMLRYSGSEQRGNERNRLILRAKNMAENIAIYGASQLTTKLYRLASVPVMHFPWTGTSRNRLYMPPDSVMTTAFTSPSNCEMRAGILSVDSTYNLVTDTTDPNYGLQVRTAMVPIITKATATHTALGSVTAYTEQDMEMALTPLFQFGMFYNMDMELYPSATFSISGPVHTNNRLMAHPDAAATISITFQNRVSIAEGLYADHSLKAMPRNQAGAQNPPTLANGDIYFYNTAATPVATDLKDTSNLWRDHKYRTTTETTTTLAQFKTFATNTYGSNLRTSVHGVTKLSLPGIGTYKEQDDPSTPEDERSNGRQIIEPPNADKWVWNSSTSTGAWTTNTDDSDVAGSKLSYKCGLYIVANPSTTNRTGHLPDGTTVRVLPRSYRAWLNTTDLTTGVHTIREVVLPGQPSYGYNNGPDGTAGTSDDYMYENLLPNRYILTSVCGDGQTGNQVLRIPQQDYGLATGYTLSSAGVIGDTTINVSGGSYYLRAGEVVDIGSYRYLVTSSLSSGSFKIAPPGLIAAAASGATVTIDAASRTVGTGSGYKTNGVLSQNATAITINTGSGTILPGNTISFGASPAYKYLVVAVATGSSPTTVYIAKPGLRESSISSATAVTVDSASGNLGTGTNYLINNSSGYSAGYNTMNTASPYGAIAIDNGSGTIRPGDIVAVGAQQYMVSIVPTASLTQIWVAAPSLIDAITDNTPVFVDPFRASGYDTSLSPAYPADSASGTALNPGDYYFYDIRRANSNRGVVALSGTTGLYDRYDVPYVPRPIAKIDLDMIRLRMMVDRTVNSATTSTCLDVRNPNGSGIAQATWSNSIYNPTYPSSLPSLGLGMGSSFNVFPTSSTLYAPDPFKMYYAPTAALATTDDPTSYAVPATGLYDPSNPCPWYDGVAIYIESVDAEKRVQTTTNGLGTPLRIDSGVRFLNGRGPIISLTATGVTGFTCVTNDAVYIIGDFNADGTVDTNTAHQYTNGYSATWPDSTGEYLASIMGDAVTIVSQPLWTSATGGQTEGWNDALSALPNQASSSGWRTGSNASSAIVGTYDGVYATSGCYPGLFPNDSTSGSLGSTKTTKMAPTHPTEVSTALVVGIVPSNHNPTQLTDGYVPTFSLPASGNPAQVGNGVNSGGANNFPRLLDNWNGQALWIRGSMVALFESRVAMEPFTNSRCYNAPGRFWGLHHGFSTQNHDVPLEPIVLSATRVGFRELTASEYTSMKSTIEALP
ncbi:MAG TPA: hypothetical protein VHD61_00125 [Lacunisphaera sp.]|nr:hypothetical protein [Lacunisphaera sp.]